MKKLIIHIVFFSLLAIFPLNPALAESSTIIINVLEDSYVNSSSPNTNYDAEQFLDVGRSSSQTNLAYLKFDLGSIPEGMPILSAKLRLYCTFAYPNPVVCSHYLDDDTWDEQTITWNNSPKTWNTVPSDTKDGVYGLMYFDITDEIIQAYSDNGIISLVLRLTDDSSMFCIFYSEQKGIPDQMPMIEVEVSVPKYGGGDGTQSDPYLIYTPEQLSSIGNNPEDWSSHFILMSDVNLSDYTGDEFSMIGPEPTASFNGIFDGNFHTISNFTFTPTDGFNYSGLFGVIGANGIVRNLGLVNTDVNCEGNGTGSLAGLSYGLVENCFASSVNVHGGFSVGGLIGNVYEGLVRNCYVNSGNVSVQYGYAGGFVGNSDSDIVNCYSVCAVNGPGSGLGGFSGLNRYGNLVACFYNEDVTGNLPYWGEITSDTVHMQSIGTYTNYGWDFIGETINGVNDIWDICPGQGYPWLWWQDTNCPEKYGGGRGTEQDPYQIYTAQQLNTLGASLDDWDKHFVLMNDLDLSDYSGTEFNLIGNSWLEPFTGFFNGNGHTISNLSYSTTEFYNSMGLFECIGPNSIVENLGLLSPSLHGGANSTGALAGALHGTVRKCWAIDVSIIGEFRSGGLVGRIYGEHGKLINSYIDGGDVSVGYNYGGGLVGENDGNIINCYSTASVSGSGGPQGGLIGYTTSNGSVAGSFWDMDVSGESSSSGGGPLPTVLMYYKLVFLNNDWDFIVGYSGSIENIWRMCVEGIDYPRLQCQYRRGDFRCPDGIDNTDLSFFTDEWLLEKLSFDFNLDSIINFPDWAVFSNAWQTTPASGNWNPNCDISPKGGDDVINEDDLVLFVANWLKFSSENLLSDIAPHNKTDGIVNFSDFAVLAEQWLN